MAHLTPFKILGSFKMFVSFTCEQGSFHHAWFVKGSPTSTSLNSDLPVLPSRPRQTPRTMEPYWKSVSSWCWAIGRAKQATYVQWRLGIWSQMRFFFCVLCLGGGFKPEKKWSERKEGKLTVRKLMSLSEGWNHRLELDLPLWLYVFEKKLCEEEMGSRNFWYEWPALRVLV